MRDFVKSGDHVFIHGSAATPMRLIDELVGQAGRLRDVTITHLHTEGEMLYARPEYAESFRVKNLFVGANLRHKLNYNRIDYVPCSLSQVPGLFRSGRLPVDVALIHVSPPDQHGYCTLGTAVDVARAAVDVAKVVVAQINPNMPRVSGDSLVHIDKINHWIEVNDPLPVVKHLPPSREEKQIGQIISGLIEDGSTLQVGIGAIPDAVLGELYGHRDLGIHTEMWSDGLLGLLEKGVVTNSRKVVHPGHTVSGFVLGTEAVYKHIHENPSCLQLDTAYVNNPRVIARNPKVVAINSAVQIDLTGQVCADSIGHEIISGAGGQLDFIRAAGMNPDGKPIIAMTSRTRKGISRIVAELAPGAGVVTPRTDVRYVVTEYGICDLYGLTLGERARALIAIAHPDDREVLERAWHQLVR